MRRITENKPAVLSGLLLLAAIAFNLVVLYPEVALDAPYLNDNALHFTLVERAVEALERGEDPTDPWVPYFVQGYPLFHHYQHLPHVTIALLFEAFGGAVPLWKLFKALNYLLLSTFPLSIYWSGRRLGFAALPAALAGALASLLSTAGLYGFDLASYVWRGYGMTTQLWGMWLLGPAIAGVYVTLRQGRAYAGTAALLAATLLSHTLLGYVALLSAGLVALLGGVSALGRRLGRLFLVLLLVAVVASYFLLPFILDHAYMNRSVWEDPGKYDAYGWEWTLKALVTGGLLDEGRFPSLTLLAGLGLVVCLYRWRQAERYRLLVVFFGFWLCLYFGRPTWGILLDILPMSGDLHLHRLIAPVHLGAIGLACAGLAWLWEQVQARRRAWQYAGMGLLSVALLAPVYVERVEYLATNNTWMQENVAAFQADAGAMDDLLSDLRAASPGRVYAGRAANWGDDYTIGSVPVYTLLAVNQFDNPGYLYHALSLNADIEGYLDESRPATFNLFNLRYIVAPGNWPAPAFAYPLAVYDRHYLYGVATTGYFDLVDSDYTLYGERSEWLEAARAWLQSRWLDYRQHPAIVFGSAPAGSPDVLQMSAAPALMSTADPPQRELCGWVLSGQVAGNAYTVEFEAGRACWLLLKQTFHPGWEARLDGVPVSTRMLAPSFVGVQVTPGRHYAEFVYSPQPWRGMLGIVGLVVLALAGTAERLRARWESRARASLAPLAGLAKPLEPAWGRFSASLAARWGADGKWIAALLAFVLLAGLPTLQLKVMGGHDAFEYLPRAIEFYRVLSDGVLFPRWAPDLGGGYGYPFFIFNPPLIYYLASAFHALGITVVASLDLACLSLLALAGLGMYAFTRQFYGRAGGLVAGVAYVLAPYTLTNLYVRHALADYTAMAFIPWALWGLARWMPSRLARGGGFRYLLVAAGATGLLVLSSNPVALMAVPVLSLYALFLAWRARSWSGLARGAGAIGLGLGLSAFFWLPALSERTWVKTHQLLSGYLNYTNHFVYLHQLVHSPWGYGLSLPGWEDGMSFGLGLAHLVLLVVSLLVAWRLSGLLRNAGEGWAHVWFFVGLLGLTVLLVTDNSIWLWNALPLLQYLEFPWRFLVLGALATAFMCAFPFFAMREPRRRGWLLAAVLAGLFLTGMPHARPEGYYDTTDAEYAPEVIAEQGLAVTTAREYEPVWVGTQPEEPAPPTRLVLLGGQVRVLESQLRSQRYEWLVEASVPAQLRAATFYYPGWRLTVDGQERPFSAQNPYGLIDFSLEQGIHRVVLTFGLTSLRRWATWISIGAVLLLGLAGLAVRRSE